jgi:hypothetical protein
MKTVETASLPVFDTVDVLVAGGGPAVIVR